MNITSYISHTLTIHCPNHKALTFIKIIVQQINYVMKCLGQVTSKTCSVESVTKLAVADHLETTTQATQWSVIHNYNKN